MELKKEAQGKCLDLAKEIPWLTALRILGLAHPHFLEKRGIRFGELIMKYQNGGCKISRVERAHAFHDTYMVQVLGSGTLIEDKTGNRSWEDM